MSKGMKRFFIICAATIILGALLSVVGFASGGIESMEKVSEKYSWLRIGGEYTDTLYIGKIQGGDEFDVDGVVVKGEMDVRIKPIDLSSDTKAYGTFVEIRYDDSISSPDYRTDNGILVVDSGSTGEGVYVDISENTFPEITVYVPMGTNLASLQVDTDAGDIDIGDVNMGNIELSTDNGDIELDGTTWSSLSAASEAGDIDLYNVTSPKMSIQSEYGDIEISGNIKGNTEIASKNGAVEIATAYGEEDYTVDVQSEYGDIEVGDNTAEGGHHTYGNGADKIKIHVRYGDTEILFGAGNNEEKEF